MDGNPLSLKQFQGIDPSIASKELTAEKHAQNELLQHFYTQLRKIGVNVNQIAHIANLTGNTNTLKELQNSNEQLELLREEITQWQYSKS